MPGGIYGQRPPVCGRRDFLKLAAAAGIGAGLAGCGRRPPNVVLIFADDLGYGDLGSYGSTTIRTPNIDRIGEEGIRFTDFHSACSVCSPSRASLLTGRYPSRCGVPFAVGGVYSDLGLQESEITLAEILRDAGYATACVGKWHLGIPSGFDYLTHAGFTTASEFHPARHGFELFFGMVGNTNPDGSTALLSGDGAADLDAHVTTITEHFTERTVEFIAENRRRRFFVYLPHTRSHAPWMANPRFAGRSKGGVYGDMVEEMDWSTGEILRALSDFGLARDTIVLFTSDNGAGGRGSNGPLRGTKGSTFEGGMRVPCLMRWPQRVPAGRTVDIAASALDLMPTLAGLAGARIPQDRAIDGVDLWPAITGARDIDDRPFYYYNGLNLQAVREGRWKLHLPRSPDMLVWWDSGPRDLAAPMLFDLEADPAETRDVAREHPDTVRRLLETAEQARAELGSWDRRGSDQKAIEHMMGDRRSLRHLRTQQGHRTLGPGD